MVRSGSASPEETITAMDQSPPRKCRRRDNVSLYLDLETEVDVEDKEEEDEDEDDTVACEKNSRAPATVLFYAILATLQEHTVIK